MKIVLFIFLSFCYNADNSLQNIFQYFNNGIPSDDPKTYEVDTTINYYPTLDSTLYWIVPNGKFPESVEILKSNNNVAIEFFDGRIFIAFRSSGSHFAGSLTKIIVLSSKDGLHWDEENIIDMGLDIREPLFIKMNNRLMLYYFKAGTSSIKFEPSFTFMIERIQLGQWKEEKQVSEVRSRVFWSMKNRFNKIYATSYEGEHYKVFGKSDLRVTLLESSDGVQFNEISNSPQYTGGVSEVAFEFDDKRNFWAVSRNEDGDKTGFGSHLIFANKDRIDKWKIYNTSKKIYMSPRMFRHGDELYLIARRNKGFLPFGFMPKFFPKFMQRCFNWLKFTTSSKTTSLYRINKKHKKIEYLFDFPGSGDTAFPAIRRLDENSFLIANYTSDITKKNRWWIFGQIKPTYIYISKLSFEPIAN